MTENVVPFRERKQPVKYVRPVTASLIEQADEALKRRVRANKMTETEVINRAIVFYDNMLEAFEGLEPGDGVKLTIPLDSDNVFHIRKV